MASNTAQLIAEVDALNEQDKFDEVYNKLKRSDGDYSSMDLDLMWRLARTIRFLGNKWSTFLIILFSFD